MPRYIYIQAAFALATYTTVTALYQTSTPCTPSTPCLHKVSGLKLKGSVEAGAYHAPTSKLYMAHNVEDKGSIACVDLESSDKPTDCDGFGDLCTFEADAGVVNSVAVCGDWLAAAVQNVENTANGFAFLYNIAGGDPKVYTAGPQPDSIAFTEDCKYLVVANEGEPNEAVTVDPEGSVQIIDITIDSIKAVTFEQYNSQVERLEKDGVRIFGHVNLADGDTRPATAAENFEPESIAIDGKFAYVTLQESNAIAVINIETAECIGLHGLGFKRWLSYEMDAKDDDKFNVRRYRNVYGIYQPDGIATFQHDGETYLIMANEGDTRDYEGYSELVRAGDQSEDYTRASLREMTKPDVVNDAGTIVEEGGILSRLLTSTETPLDAVYTFGGRSMSIRRLDGELVYDSGDQIARAIDKLNPLNFNANGKSAVMADLFDDRSDDKGSEPKSVVVGQVNDRTYAFVCLERQGGIVVFDITEPKETTMHQYINTDEFTRLEMYDDGEVPDSEQHFGYEYLENDVAPEGMVFIPATDDECARLVVMYQVSGTMAVFKFTV